ncbi:MAG: hypothetical protein WBB77_02280, partial [Candidatus Nanopelagicales bacterium]
MTSNSSARPLRISVDALAAVLPVSQELGTRFADRGFELALVGGSVRDAMLGRLGSDLDYTTNARPEDVIELVTGWADAIWDVGIKFGTVAAR